MVAIRGSIYCGRLPAAARSCKIGGQTNSVHYTIAYLPGSTEIRYSERKNPGHTSSQRDLLKLLLELTPRLSAGVRSHRLFRSLLPSTVVGPPRACTPVNVDCASVRLESSARHLIRSWSAQGQSVPGFRPRSQVSGPAANIVNLVLKRMLKWELQQWEF